MHPRILHLIVALIIVLQLAEPSAYGTGSCDNNLAPIARAGDDHAGQVGVPVSLNGSASSDSDGQVTGYWWNFGDGQYTGWQSAAVASHTFTEAGTYSVRLWVRDDCLTMSAADYVVVTVSTEPPPDSPPVPASGARGAGAASNELEGPFGPDDPCADNQPPVANAGSDKSGQVGQALSFNGGASYDPDGSIISYEWDFGDGDTASGRNATHAYEAAGTYWVTLTVFDGCDDFDGDQAVVSVQAVDPCAENQPPVASAGSDQSGEAGQSLGFNGNGSYDPDGAITSYQWDFGDGYTASGASAMHAYAQAGTYAVTLTICDNCGANAADQLTVQITVPDPPPGELQAGFEIEQLVGFDTNGDEIWEPISADPNGVVQVELGLHIRYNGQDYSTGAANYRWRVNGSLIGTDPFVYRTYTDTRQFELTLTVYNADWSESDTAGPATVSVAPVMQVIDAGPAQGLSVSDMVVDGSTAWITHVASSISHVDISDPDNVALIGTFTAPFARAAALANGRMYLAAGMPGLYIYPLPFNPSSYYTYDTYAQDGQQVQDVAVAGNLAYLAAGPAGFKVLDVSNPASPILVGRVTLPGSAWAYVLRVSEGMAYLTDNAGRIFLIDISMFDIWNPVPGTPVVRRTIDNGAFASTIELSGHGWLVAASLMGLDFYDVSDPGDPNPNHLCNLAVPSAHGRVAGGIALVGNRLYASYAPCPPNQPEVARVDVTDPSAPYEMESLSTFGYVAGGSYGPALRSGALYWGTDDNEVLVIDVPEE